MLRLFVSNINYEADEADVRKAFLESGYVPEVVRLCRDRETGKSRGFAFVDLQEGGRQAIEEMDGSTFMERRLNVREAQERVEHGPRGGQRNGHGRRDNGGNRDQGSRSREARR